MSQIDRTTQVMPRSVLRHRPITPSTETQGFQIPRASRSRAASVYTEERPGRQQHWLIAVGLTMLLMVLVLWGLQSALAWGNIAVDDLHYGRPRTTQIDRFVGHETAGTPSHFTGMNISGQIYLLEIPGGNPEAAHLFVGPHLLGATADLAPVSLHFVGNPRTPDLIVEAAGVQIRFSNTGKHYVPASMR